MGAARSGPATPLRCCPHTKNTDSWLVVHAATEGETTTSTLRQLTRGLHSLVPGPRALLGVLVLVLAGVPFSTGQAVASTSEAAAEARAHKIRIETLSNHSDLISGGEPLVHVTARTPKRLCRRRLFVGSREVTSSFAVRPDGTFEGLITGLALGE